MTQKNNLNGILLLDKPLMLSSNHAIQKIKNNLISEKLDIREPWILWQPDFFLFVWDKQLG